LARAPALRALRRSKGHFRGGPQPLDSFDPAVVGACALASAALDIDSPAVRFFECIAGLGKASTLNPL
jgi:hypothetical protein